MGKARESIKIRKTIFVNKIVFDKDGFRIKEACCVSTLAGTHCAVEQVVAR